MALPQSPLTPQQEKELLDELHRRGGEGIAGGPVDAGAQGAEDGGAIEATTFAAGPDFNGLVGWCQMPAGGHIYASGGGGVIVSGCVAVSTVVYGHLCAPRPPPQKLPKEFVWGEIIAWRVWRPQGEYLYSISRCTRWEPGVPMRGDPKPGGCEGVYAYSTRKYAEHHVYPPYNRDLILGTVALWGRVIQCQVGYRAEYADIMSLDAGPPRVLREMRKLYLGFDSEPELPFDSSDWTGREVVEIKRSPTTPFVSWCRNALQRWPIRPRGSGSPRSRL